MMIFFQDDITCDECYTGLDLISDLLKTDEFAKKVVNDLENPVYCGNPEYITEADSAECVKFVELVGKSTTADAGNFNHFHKYLFFQLKDFRL